MLSTSNNYYDLLGVSSKASLDEIKSAFRQKVKETHPDLNKSTGAEEEFKKINEAYYVLSDENRRYKYDNYGYEAISSDIESWKEDLDDNVPTIHVEKATKKYESSRSTTVNTEYPITGKDVVTVVVSTLLILLGGFIVIGALGTMELVTDDGNVDMDTIDEWASGNFDTLPMSLKVAAMFTQMLLIIPAWVFIRRRRLSAMVYLRMRPVPVQLIFYSVLIGLGVAVVGDEISRLINYVLPLPEEMAYGIQRMMQIDSVLDFLTMGLTVILIAPVVEEMLFRGFFQRYFEARRGVTSGVMMASALFAVYHFNIYWLIPILLMATVMGAMAWRAESVLPTIIVHLTNNSLGLIAANVYPDEEPGWFLMGDHVHPVILLIAAAMLVWGLRSYFRLSERQGLGGHGPGGAVGKNIDSAV